MVICTRDIYHVRATTPSPFSHFLPTMVFSPLVEDYATSLKELTFNSRPIIVNLTTIAKENTDEADGILAAITHRIYHCIPEHKLFALYLLDLICKTVGAPYNVLIGDDIFKLFSHVYLLVDTPTRARLVKMFDLWRVFRVKGGALPLFPLAEMERIEAFLQQAGFRRAPAGPTAALLVADIDALLPAMERRLRAGGDQALAERCAALADLRALLQSQALGPADLAGVLQKLALMKQQEQNQQNLETQAHQQLMLQNQGLLFQPQTPITQPQTPLPQTPSTLPPTPQTLPAQSLAPSLTQTPVPTELKARVLFGELLASGLVAVDQSLKPGSRPVYSLVFPRHKYLGAPATNALEQLLLDASGQSQYVQIKVKELSKVQKAAAPLQRFVASGDLDMLTLQVLYETKLSKCAQCGKRFTGDDDGAARKRVHLDWHFRINKRLTNHKANIQSRTWYISQDEWVHFDESSLSEQAAAPVARAETAAAAPARAQYVVVPPSETNMNNTCIVCREQVKATYNDALGEWVWDACVYAPGTKTGRKIAHAACLEETSRKRGPDGLPEAKRVRV